MVLGGAAARQTASSRVDGTVSVSPSRGDLATTFRFRGSGWRPRTTLTLTTETEDCTNGDWCAVTPLTARIRTDRKGRFSYRFGYRRPEGEDREPHLGIARPRPFCFKAPPTKKEPGPIECVPIVVQPPTVVAEPSFVLPDPTRPVPVRLVFSGWLAGDVVAFQLKPPDGGPGRELTAFMQRRAGDVSEEGKRCYRAPAFSEAETCVVYLPAGSGIAVTEIAPDDPPGYWIVVARGEDSGVRARTTFFVAPCRRPFDPACDG
jgi:hypothetical protein